jgi:hypothetical protein
LLLGRFDFGRQQAVGAPIPSRRDPSDGKPPSHNLFHDLGSGRDRVF